MLPSGVFGLWSWDGPYLCYLYQLHVCSGACGEADVYFGRASRADHLDPAANCEDRRESAPAQKAKGKKIEAEVLEIYCDLALLN
jgi:hypothetical protein